MTGELSIAEHAKKNKIGAAERRIVVLSCEAAFDFDFDSYLLQAERHRIASVSRNGFSCRRSRQDDLGGGRVGHEEEGREGAEGGARDTGEIWRALFGGRGDDYEKRLQHLSKEEADLLARMRRRAQFSRRGVRNLVVLSVLSEVPQSLRSTSKFHVYQPGHVQKYDFDPAAKAAAASVLASKMGAETGLKVSMGDEAKSDLTQARSSNVEVRDQKETKGKGSSQGSTRNVHTQQDTFNESVSANLEAMQPSIVVGHNQGSGISAGGWIAKIAALLIGEDPSQSYALICGNCHMHNGLAMKEDFSRVTYYCPHCHALNRSNQSIEQCRGSDSGQLSPVAAVDVVSTRDHIADIDSEMNSTMEEQERPEGWIAGKQLLDPAN
ncbi:hypothetical protein PR202_gb14972 [Eleusine coracana subsp. coracana]|uniref:Lunapark zinc ribbon domain-containing protein n=1 Tax=Eleusine coracana subsp. coracana TaxID=191504 RepID=A0AAV5EWR9_ELECO|nr:hypothetical protein PR202_gb14972 [Eleusine coracana subsp. coracana]